MSQIITLWSDKGGTGKSMIAAMVASAEWSKPVAVVDLDPQGDSAEWATKFGLRVETPDTPAEAAAIIKSLKKSFFVVVDCPPGRLKDQPMAGAGVLSCDALLIPTGTGKPDLNALGRAIKALEELNAKGAGIKAGVILNHFRETTRARTVEEGLGLVKITLLGRLAERTSYPEAFSDGRNLLNLGGAAAYEAKALVARVAKWV
jgi:cellulose biosynthesis protein BcsQ